ncbi:MAG: hypothetical protein ACJ746_06955 [Bryobacteraceae bacterium]
MRWSDSPSAPALELPGEVVDNSNSEPIVRVSLKINEQTAVTLLGKDFMLNGIVRSCRPEKDCYLVTVATDDVSGQRFEQAHFRDPGVLALDDFLTEEEEAKILESLEDRSGSRTNGSLLGTICHRLVSSVRLGQTGLLLLFPAAKPLLCSAATV